MDERLEQWCPEHVTTGFIAQHCGVSKVTVLHWIKKECLPAFRLPDGHYRIHREGFAEFLLNYNIPTHKGVFKRVIDI